MKKKTSPVLAVVLLIIVVVLMVAGKAVIEKYVPSKEKADLKEYYQLKEADDTAVIVDNVKQDTTAKLVAGKIYVEYRFLHDTLNQRFYWDGNENKLLYTTPSEVTSVAAGSSEYQTAKEKHTENYTIVYADADKTYVALDFVEKYTNIKYKMYKDPNRITVTKTWGTVEQSLIKKDAELRVKGGIKSPILRTVKKDESVTIVESGEKWTKVCTKDGYIGYVKNRQLDKAEKKELKSDFKEPQITHNLKKEKINMAWHQVTTKDANSTIATVLQNTKGINVIAPTWFYLNDNNGNIANLASLDYVNYCHQNNIEVWGLVSNLENKDVDTAAVLTHTSTRQYLVNQIISAAIQYDLDGINLDFESLNSEAVGDSYIQFIRELSLKCANNGVVLSVDNYVPSAYTAFYDREEQANFADYVVIMGYDEHYAGSDEGSVASIGFVTNGVADTLKEVPADQIILGCPFYTRIWAETPKADDEEDTTAAAAEDYVPYDLTSEAVGMDTVQKRLELNGATPTWSEEDGQNYAEYVNDGVTYKVWIEDAASLEKKLEVMKSNKLAGISFWKLGFETDSIWDTIIKYTNN